MYRPKTFNLFRSHMLSRFTRGFVHVSVLGLVVTLVYGDFSQYGALLPEVPRAEAAPATRTIFLTSTTTTTWTVPDDWNNASNTIHVIGGGGGGGGGEILGASTSRIGGLDRWVWMLMAAAAAMNN